MNKQVAVVGAGVMGRGIAYAFGKSNYQVYITDINEDVLMQAKAEIERLSDVSFNKGFISKDEQAAIKNNIKYGMNLQLAVKDADIVIEAVLEKMDIKIEVFKKLDQYCKVDTILATNTSTMSPTEIAAQTSRPDRVIAMHFFNPVHKMKLIEVIKGLDTSKKTVDVIRQVTNHLQKEMIEVNEFPGFVTSRMNCLIGNEAMNMLMEGVASAEDIDKAMKLGLNHPMGPLELADLVGLDTRLRNLNYLYETLGEKFRPCPLLIKYVKSGRLGKKSGQGFYKYS